MKYIIFSVCFLMMDYVAGGQTAGDFKTHQSGSWNVTTTWDQWDGSAWINPALSTPNATSGVIAIVVFVVAVIVW